MTSRHPAVCRLAPVTPIRHPTSSSLIRTEGTCRRNGSAARCCVQVSEDYYYPLGSICSPPRRSTSGGECIINKSNPINVQISWQRHRAMLAQMQMQASSLSSSSPAQTNPNPPHSISSHPIPAPRHSQFSFLSWHESECTFICMTANYSGNLSASPASSHPPKSRPTPPLHSSELNACLCIRNI